MKKNQRARIFLSMALVLVFVLGTHGPALGYGDGGDGEGSSGSREEGSSQIKTLTEDEISEIFSSVDAQTRQNMIDTFAGTSLTPRQMMSIRQQILEQNMRSAHTEASIINVLTMTVEGLDWAGEKTQLVLSFVPGVGWVTAGALDAARGGANAYRDGKSTSEIIKAATIAGVSSVTINKLSPLDADKTFNSARAGWNILTKGSGKHAGQAGYIFVKNGVKYLGKKEGERQAGNMLSSALNSSTKQVPNRAPQPTYINSPMGFDTLPNGVRVYK